MALCALALFAWLAGCPASDSARTTDSDVDGARRIVSLSPEISRVLVKVGAAHQVVAAEHVSCLAPDLAHVLDLGDACAIGPATVRALDADLVLALAGDCAPGDPADPRRVVLEAADLDGALRAWLRIGELVGRDAEAARAVDDWTRALGRIAMSRDGQGRLRVVWVVSREPLRAVGPSGVLHELLELAGAENAIHEGEARLDPGELLAAAGIDRVLDSSGAPGALEGTSAPVLRVDPRVADLPLLDPIERVSGLHAALYGRTGEAAPGEAAPGEAAAGEAAPGGH